MTGFAGAPKCTPNLPWLSMEVVGLLWTKKTRIALRCAGLVDLVGQTWKGFWRPQQESNLQLALRRGLLYPFNYGDVAIKADALCCANFQCWRGFHLVRSCLRLCEVTRSDAKFWRLGATIVLPITGKCYAL